MKEPVLFGDKFGTTELKPKLIKGVRYKGKKRGRQRTDAQIEGLFLWCFRAMGRIKPLRRIPNKLTIWPHGLSDDMKLYYDTHYVRTKGKSHGDYVHYYEKFSSTEKTTEKNRDNDPRSGTVVDLSEWKNAIS
jgi:hypothetical protein